MRKPFVAALCALLACVSVLQAKPRKPSYVPDPFILVETGIRDLGNRDTSAKSLRSQTIDTGVRNLVLIVAGQSNAEPENSTIYSPSNPTKIDNFNIYDGAIYSPEEPLVGSGARAAGLALLGYHPGLILADALVSAGKFDRVILVPVALGGSSIADWTTGVLTSRPVVAMKRLAQRGIVPGMTNVTFAFIWGQGEADALAGTTQNAYTAGFNTVVANLKVAGFSGRIFIARQTLALGSFSAAVQAAQTSNAPSGVIDNANGIYLGANADALVGNICNGGGTCRQGDNTHFTVNGMVAYATDPTYGWLQALAATGAPF
jgi:hypothetical protein